MTVTEILDREFVRSSSLYSHYSFGKRLGQGSFGVVYECTENTTGRSFACKSIDKRCLKTAADISDVRREVRALVLLKGHPCIVNLKEAFEDVEFVHLIMEKCEGGELFDELKENGPYNEDDASVVFQQMASAIAYCHANGIMHRDIKPENILFLRRGVDDFRGGTADLPVGGMASRPNCRPTRVKLADFGLSMFLRSGETTTGLTGSRYYTAPEMVQGKRYGSRADVWSLGVVLCTLLTGRLPFAGKNHDDDDGLKRSIVRGRINFDSPTWKNISSEAKDLLKKMLTVDPRARIKSKELLQNPWLTSRARNLPADSNLPSGQSALEKLTAGQDKVLSSPAKSSVIPAFRCFEPTENLSPPSTPHSPLFSALFNSGALQFNSPAVSSAASTASREVFLTSLPLRHQAVDGLVTPCRPVRPSLLGSDCFQQPKVADEDFSAGKNPNPDSNKTYSYIFDRLPKFTPGHGDDATNRPAELTLKPRGVREEKMHSATPLTVNLTNHQSLLPRFDEEMQESEKLENYKANTCSDPYSSRVQLSSLGLDRGFGPLFSSLPPSPLPSPPPPVPSSSKVHPLSFTLLDSGMHGGAVTGNFLTAMNESAPSSPSPSQPSAAAKDPSSGPSSFSSSFFLSFAFPNPSSAGSTWNQQNQVPQQVQYQSQQQRQDASVKFSPAYAEGSFTNFPEFSIGGGKDERVSSLAPSSFLSSISASGPVGGRDGGSGVLLRRSWMGLH